MTFRYNTSVFAVCIPLLMPKQYHHTHTDIQPDNRMSQAPF